MAHRNKSAQLNLRIDPKLKDAAAAAAEAEGLPLTALVENLLASHLLEGGWITSDSMTARSLRTVSAPAECA